MRTSFAVAVALLAPALAAAAPAKQPGPDLRFTIAIERKIAAESLGASQEIRCEATYGLADRWGAGAVGAWSPRELFRQRGAPAALAPGEGLHFVLRAFRGEATGRLGDDAKTYRATAPEPKVRDEVVARLKRLPSGAVLSFDPVLVSDDGEGMLFEPGAGWSGPTEFRLAEADLASWAALSKALELRLLDDPELPMTGTLRATLKGLPIENAAQGR